MNSPRTWTNRYLALFIFASLLICSLPAPVNAAALRDTISVSTALANRAQDALALWIRFFSSVRHAPGKGMPQTLPTRAGVTPGPPPSKQDRESKVARIQISPAGDVVLQPQQPINFVALPVDDEGKAIQGLPAEWSSNNQQVVTVTEGGEAVGGRPGTAILTAAAGSAREHVRVTVVEGSNEKFGGKKKVNSRRKVRSTASNPLKTNGGEIAAQKSKRKSKRAHATSSLAARTSNAAMPIFLRDPLDDPLPDDETPSLFNPTNGVGSPPGRTTTGAPTPPPATEGTESPGSANFTFDIPVINLAGRGINVSLKATYNSRTYNKSTDPFDGSTWMTYDVDSGWPAVGFHLGFGQIEDQGGFGFTLTEADGTRHLLAPTSLNNYDTQDGTFIHFNGGTGWGTLSYADGTRVEYGAAGGGVRSYPTKIVDRNGNYITITYVNNVGPRIDNIKDTLGRYIRFYYDSNNDLVTITAPGFGTVAERQLIRFYYEDLAINATGLFQSAINVDAPSTTRVIKYIFLPNSTEGTNARVGYKYDYSAYGMIYQIFKQHGMTVSSTSLTQTGTVTNEGLQAARTTYNYPTTANALSDVPNYTRRTDDWAGRTTGMPDTGEAPYYTFSVNQAAGTSTVTAPDTMVTETHFIVAPGQWNDGLISEILVKQGATGPTLRRAETSWEHDTNGFNARPYQFKLTNETGQVTTTVLTYSTYNNITASSLRGFDGVEIRRVVTDYETNAAWTNRHLLRLPTSVRIYPGGSNTPASRIDYFYDTAGANLTARSGIIMHEAAFNPSSGSYDSATDKRGNVTSITAYSEAATAGGAITHASTYDIAGNVVTSEVDCCQEKSFSYSVSFYYAYVTSVVTGSGPTFTAGYDFDFNTGLLGSTTDENGQPATGYYHSDSLRPEHIDYADGGKLSFSYNENLVADAAGRRHYSLVTSKKLDSSRTVDSYRFFDGRGEVTQTFDTYTATNGWSTQDTEYDAMGRRYRTSNPYYSAGYGTSAINPAGLWTTQTVDVLGRVTRIDMPSGDAQAPTNTFVTIQHSGLFTTTTDQAGRLRRQKTDAFGNMVRVDEPDAGGNLGTTDTPNQSTSYEYDVLGNLIHINQGVQHRYFRYDSLRRLTHERQVEQDAPHTTTDSVAGNNQWSRKVLYNSDSQVENVYDARQRRTQFVYDGLNRVKEIRYFLADGTTPDPSTPTSFYYYDSQALPSAAAPFDRGYATNRLVAMTYGSNTSITGNYFGYDQSGRVIRQRQVTGSNSYELAYGYNLGGLLTSQSYPSGRILSYAYDEGGRLSQVSDGPTVYSNNFTYEPHGGLSAETWGNGAVYSVAYNRALQAGEIKLKQSASGAELQRLNYSFGVVNQADGTVDTTKNSGKIGRVDNYINGVKQWDQRFTYDSLGRLSLAKEYQQGNNSQVTWQTSYTFDRYGNRFQSGTGNSGISYTPVVTSDIDAARNRFVSTGSTPVSYDAAGNITDDLKFRGMKYTYDAHNRQTFVERDDHSNQQTSVYDCVGQRVQTTANGETRQVVYDASGQVVAEYGNGLLERENVYRGGQLLLVIESGLGSIPVPTNLTTTMSGANVVLNWSAASGATNYRVERKAAVGQFASIGTSGTTSFTDTGAGSGNAYLYRVCAADGSGNCTSGYSNAALRTVVSFTDATIVTIADDPTGATVTPVKAAHINELRSAVNAVRSLAGLSAATWTNTTVAIGSTIYKDDVKDLRDRLHDALIALNLQTSAYTDPTLAGAPNGTLIKGDHIRQLRQRVTGGVSATPSCSKSISQFIQDSYQGALGRAPSISEMSQWTATLTTAQAQGASQLLGAAQSLAATLFNSAEYNAPPGKSNEAFVTDLYEGYLHRAPDPSGYTNWLTTLNGGASRATVRQGFSDSIEFRTNVNSLCWTTVSSSGVRYVFNDLAGSARAVMNNSGVGSSTVIARHDYLPYGEEIWAGTGLRTDTQGFGAVDNTSRRYALTDRDRTTGLDHTWWREYDNLAGRWTSPDPYGGSGTTDNPQSFNRYTYTMNDPVNGVDPTGLMTCFGYHVILFRIEDGVITDVQYLGFIPVFCWEDGPTGDPGDRGPGGGSPGINPGGNRQQSNHARKKSDCAKFVDALIAEAMVDGIFGRTTVGRILGGQVLADNKLGYYKTAPVTGFKQKYINHQNGFAMAHIQGMAGAFLIGKNPLIPGGSKTGDDRAQDQLTEDHNQLSTAIAQQDHARIAEGYAELNDDYAGLQVGDILGKYIDGTKSRQDAHKEIFNLLCDF